ncbi:heterokaryon incompatibility protein-domain-containing protein [Nemania abortiva]|nr:heterokaryon incompatibility protein-domain-containing protein [Nemania abortiva]
MDWTYKGLDQRVSFVPSQAHYLKSSFSDPKPFNPATDLPETRLNRINEWEDESSEVTTGESTSTQPTPRHPCDVLAKHWDEVFEQYPFASHWGDYEFNSELKSSTCPLCMLFARAPMVAEAIGTRCFGVYTVNLLGERERLAADDYTPEHYVMGITVSVGNNPHPTRHLKGLSRRNHRRGTQGLLVPAIERGDEREYRSPYMARLIDPKQVDFGLLKKWITKCQTEHTDCQPPEKSTDQTRFTLTVVDCRSKSKAPLEQGERYLALSYRWGMPPECDDPWAVSEAPRTVRDAMDLTLKLGFRYLWVDRHCIDQNDEVKKARDVAIMDQIYENATLTIVAMAGSDDSYGLPGLGTEPVVSRNEPLRAGLAGHTLVSLNPDIITSVRESEWASRAWTFQEALLSKRCLLFTPDQVYFICRTTHWSEFLPNFPNIRATRESKTDSEFDPYSGSDPEVTLSNLFFFKGGHHDQAESELAKFVRDMNMYMKRMLGDQNDGLNAFRGILSRSSYWSYYGVPLVTRVGRELSETKKSEVNYEILPTLPGTISNSVRIILDKLARDRRLDKMIAATASAAPKKRLRRNLFGNTYYDYYTNDCLPGAGEPFHPSPTLAFLYGLGWAVQPHTTCHRRAPMPTWSWVSIYGGSIFFRNDPDDIKELRTDVYTMPSSDVKVWLSADRGLPPRWIEFDEKFQSSPTKLIPEHSPLMRIESRVGGIGDVKFRPSGWDSDYDSYATRPKVSVSIIAPVGAKVSEMYEVFLDCVEELPQHDPDEETTTWHDLGWKFVLISRASIYNPEPAYRDAWADWLPANSFLVIRPFGQYWKRVGLLRTNHKLYRYAERDTVVLA